jgi:hypothetical protein
MTDDEPPVDELVRYPYVVSAVVATFRFESRPHRVRSVDGRYLRAIPYLLISLLFGWWAVPWGPIQTWRAMWDCLNGGLEVEG